MSLGPQDTTALLDHVHIGFLFAWYSFSWASADGAAHCVYRKWLLEVFLGPFTNVNDRIMPISGPKTTGIQQGLRPCPLRSEISPVFSESIDDVCTVDDEICKAFAIWHWGTLFLKYSTIFLRTLSQIGEPLPIFTSERLCLSKTSLL